MQPKVSASLSLSPMVFSETSAPKLSLSITSHHSTPITIYAEDLSPTIMLKCGVLSIISLTTGAKIPQHSSRRCKIPLPFKVKIPLLEERFFTLAPELPVTFTEPFLPYRTVFEDKSLAMKKLAGSDHESATNRGYGVEGLVPDDYVLHLTPQSTWQVDWTHVRWWDYGTKEEVLSQGLDGRPFRYSPGPYEPLLIDTSPVTATLYTYKSSN